MNIESALWKVVAYNDGYAHITQKASGVVRMVSRGLLPSTDVLAQLAEGRFNKLLREAFHGS